PLRVGELSGNHRSIRGNGICAPMNKDSEIRLVKPRGRRTLVNRFPGGFVFLSKQRKGKQAEQPGQGILHFHQRLRSDKQRRVSKYSLISPCNRAIPASRSRR